MKKIIAGLLVLTTLIIGSVALAADPSGHLGRAQTLIDQAQAEIDAAIAEPLPTVTATETVTATVTQTVTATPTTPAPTTPPPTTPPPTTPPPAPGFPSRDAALARSNVVVSSGSSSAQYRVGSPPADTTYDLRGHTSTAFPTVHQFPYSIGRDTPGARTVLVGGTAIGTQPRTWSWDQVHAVGGGGLTLKGTDFQVSYDFTSINQHDGIQVLPGGTTKFLVEGAYMEWIRDDAVEDDTEFSGTIRDSLFNGVNTCVSIGQSTKNPASVVNIEDVICVFEPMVNARAADGVGHQALFKQAPGGTVNLKNVTLCYTENPISPDRLQIWPNGTKQNVRIVLGPDFVGAYPGTLPAGVTVSRDWSICTSAVDNWKVAHGV